MSFDTIVKKHVDYSKDEEKHNESDREIKEDSSAVAGGGCLCGRLGMGLLLYIKEFFSIHLNK